MSFEPDGLELHNLNIPLAAYAVTRRQSSLPSMFVAEGGEGGDEALEQHSASCFAATAPGEIFQHDSEIARHGSPAGSRSTVHASAKQSPNLADVGCSWPKPARLSRIWQTDVRKMLRNNAGESC